MPVVYSCIAPHGTDIVPALAKNRAIAERFSMSRRGMLQIARQLRKAKPDVIVIASPHNLRLWKKIAISFAENSTGSLRSDSKKGQTITLSVRNDTKFAKQLYSRSLNNGLPVVGANYGTFEGPASDLPMDWGTMVPLWFLTESKAKQRRVIKSPHVVVVSPSREISIRQNMLFGREIARLSEEQSETRVAFVASADQAHSHKRNGPYGFHPSASRFDMFVVEAVKGNKLDSLTKLDPSLIEDARPDSVWQLAILQGLMQEVRMTSHFFSYEVPTYFGMLCAGFTPT